MAYAYQNYNEEKQARGIASALPISTKDAIEISNTIRNLNVSTAKRILEDAINLKKPIPFRRFCNGVGHKKGKMAAGRYPIKACKHILSLLKSVESNAINKGLSGELKIISIISNKGSRPARYGRQRGREAKRSSIELVIEEVMDKGKKEVKKEIKEKKEVKKEEVETQ